MKKQQHLDQNRHPFYLISSLLRLWCCKLQKAQASQLKKKQKQNLSDKVCDKEEIQALSAWVARGHDGACALRFAWWA